LLKPISTDFQKGKAVHDSSRERWFFYQDVAGLWKWARLDIVGTILGHSGIAFDSREQCVEHARGSGYVDPETAKRLALVHDWPTATGMRVTPI